ncbi:LysE/ArgO family amino acid transporter [Chungangia koreensis]|uniref:LysE/ArgO family amino acid transporter n=1 Tax=Chungangia koreensis TaxID=752657 RepID=A0ABV8X7Y1_9LACT
MSEAIVHGIILAFSLILPLGAQNVFVFNVGARQPSFLKVIPVVITAGLCDTILILMAVLGVSLIVLSFTWLKTVLLAVGFLFLLYMGWSVWKSAPNGDESELSMTIKKQVLFAVSVSLLNPHAILDTVGVIGTNALSYKGNEKLAFAAATIAVSWIWFFGLALTGRLIGRIDHSGKWFSYLNKISAILIWSVALFLLTKLF